MKKKQKWDWSKWIAALEEAAIPEKSKALGREIPPVMRRSRKALAPWELPSAPGYGELHSLAFAGLLYLIPGAGHFVPIIDPLPKPNSINTTPFMRRVLRMLLRGADLTFTEKDSRYAHPGWRLRSDWNSYRNIPINQQSLNKMLKLGIIEWNGCGNWPRFNHRVYRANKRRIAGVRGFRSQSLRWIKEGIERTAA